MPKQIHKIDQFHGGLNSNSDPRDITDNELSEAQDIMVDEIGRVRTMGGTSDHQSNQTGVGAHNSHITPGYGLFQWNHDRIDGHTSSAGSSDPVTGANYLAFSDTDAHSSGKLVRIYSAEDDTWGEPITGLSDNTSGNRKDVFYSADGALRVCDSDFDNTNLSQWYGYIDRVFFKSVSDTVIVDQWYQTAQSISSPDDTSEFDNIQYTSVTYTGGGGSYSHSADSATYDDITEATLDGGADTVLNMVGGIEVTVTLTTTAYGTEIPDFDDFLTTFTITTGSANLGTNAFLGVSGTSHKTDDKSEWGESAASATKAFTYTFSFGDTYLGGGSIGDDFVHTVTAYGIQTTLTNIVLGEKIASAVLTTVKVTEAVVDSDNAQAKLTTGNVFMQILQKTPSDTTNMIPRGWGKEWEYGVSLIYDEKQESLIRTLFDSGNSNKTELDNTDGEAKCPELKLYVDTKDSTFNRRITGAVWYIREASGGETANQFTAQVEFDFVKGISKVLSSGKETDCLFNPHADSNVGQYEFIVDNDHLLSPNLVDTYTSRTGILRDEIGIKARYKTAVMVGRRMYVGNVKTKDESGFQEVKGDAMLKSPVNRFDTFPSKSIVEAAINDGESIVALEEFADRILQFKENTLYIINVSQDIEFLEDVYKHKGVSHPAAVCKTDYGIAWANHLGCYLYDGKQVINLLEKGGRQIIKEQEWFNFLTPGKDSSYAYLNGTHSGADHATIVTDSAATYIASALVGGTIYNVTDGSFALISANAVTTITGGTLQGGSDNSWDTNDVYRLDITNTVMTPMIGYLPKKRQLVVFDDITDTGLANPRMYLYDMVTQSWVKGANNTSNRIIDTIKTNFVTDWNGDLVYAHTADTGTVLKWDDASSTSDTLVLMTKDIDFGQPGVRKKVYKVYLTYKGDARYVVILYGVDGLEPTRNFFPITSATDGSSAGGSGTTTPLMDAGDTDWLKAELKPSTPLLTNNISSFRFEVRATVGGTVIPIDFEINDISIVYRLKSVK